MNYYKLENGFNIKKTIITISVFLLVIYGLFNSRNIILGPKIKIFTPMADSETKNNAIVVKGLAQNVTFLSLNNRIIYVNKEGVFEGSLILVPGFNTIEIKARDRFGKEDEENFKIYYKEDALPAPM